MRVLYFGTASFAVPALRAIADSRELVGVVSQPDRPSGRGLDRSPSPITMAAAQLGIEALRPEKCRAAEFLESVHALSPDVLVVAAYGQILPMSLLEAAPRGGLNIHGSLLPKWRGAAPIQRAIQHGDTETGVTIMQMDKGMDTGDILLLRPTPIGPDETADALSARLAALGAEAIVYALERLDELSPAPQNHERATYAPIIEKAEGLVDWSRPATELYNRFRAFYPWPGIYTSYNGRLLRLTCVRTSAEHGASGTVLRIGAEGAVVGCGSGSLLLMEAQPEGRQRMSIQAFANGYGLAPGAIMG